ncbi:MAG: response regulator transcription factor [Exilispira sp.]|nr:response regulator transcription factor [Exilispira sp.]
MKKYKIIIVDDNWEICILFKTIIQNLEMFEVVSFDNGSKFLEFIEDEAFDVAIIDIDLPDISGYELIKKLREDNFNYIPVVVISAFDDFSHKIKALELGADDYIVKPVNVFEVVIKLNNLLKRQTYLCEINKRESIIQDKTEIIDMLKTFFHDKVYLPAKKLKSEFEYQVNAGIDKMSMEKTFETFKILNEKFGRLIDNYDKLFLEVESKIEKINEKNAQLISNEDIEERFKTKF